MSTYSLQEGQDYLARKIEDSLHAQITSFGTATFLLTGGQTIVPFLKKLASISIPWERVTVALSDDRLVSSESTDSNEFMLKNNFLRLEGPNKAKYVSLISSYSNEEYSEILKMLPISSQLLSMGEDGHLASLFPEDNKILECEQLLYYTNRSDFERISLPMSQLIMAKNSYILVGGKRKIRFYEENIKDSFPLSPLFRKSEIIKLSYEKNDMQTI